MGVFGMIRQNIIYYILPQMGIFGLIRQFWNETVSYNSIFFGLIAHKLRPHETQFDAYISQYEPLFFLFSGFIYLQHRYLCTVRQISTKKHA